MTDPEMVVLALDAGNTRIKWARLERSRMGRQHAAVYRDLTLDDYRRRVIGKLPAQSRIVVASVAGTRTNAGFRRAARTAGIEPEFVATERHVAGIRVGYLEPWRLGVDRLLAVAGAHDALPRKALLVAGVGTALTLDLVDGDGQHLGGSIVPGPRLMVESLLKQTSGIRRRSRGGGSVPAELFARSTRAGVQQGARYAAASLIDRASLEARKRLGRAVRVVLTGGDTAFVRPLVQSSTVLIPDLVLRGLAVWAGESKPLGRRAVSTAAR